MRRFSEWLSEIFSPEARDREKVDAAIYNTFTGRDGKIVLDYLIASHYAMVTPPTLLDQAEYNEGRRLVIQDILDSMDRYREGNPETIVETEEKRNA